MAFSFKFIPLSFINSNDEILKQIRNSVVFAHLFEQFKTTSLKSYLENTQYGYTASALENGKHRLLRITDITHGKVAWENVPFCDCSDAEKYLLQDDDILIARTGGTTGKSFLVEAPPTNAVFASYLIRLRIKRNVHIEFINAFLNSYCFWSQISELKSGSAQPNVNAEKLKELVIPECDFETQRKVVQIVKEKNGSPEFASVWEKLNLAEQTFQSCNQISSELNHQLALVKELRQTWLREAMQGKLVPQDTADEPAAHLLEKIKAEKEKLVAEKKIKKDKPLPEIKAEEIPFKIPSNWAWCRLGEIVSTIFDGPFGSHLKTADYTEKGIQVVRLENIGYMKFNIEKETFISEEKYKTINQHTVYENDVLVSSFIADGVKTTLIPKLKHTAIAKADCFTLRTFDNWAVKKFIVYALSSEPIYDDFLQYSHGMTRLRINTTQLKKLMFPLPPLAEQKWIVEQLEKLMKYCDELEANIRASKAHAESLLQVALKEALAG